MKDHGFGWGLHLDEAASSVEGRGREGASCAARERIAGEARAPPAAGDDGAPGRGSAPPLWLEGQPPLDLIVTLDDATGETIYSAFLVEEEGTASTFRALKEVACRARAADEPLHRPQAHYFLTPEAGGEVDRNRLDAGRSGRSGSSGVEHIGAYSPQARGRSERAFLTLQ